METCQGTLPKVQRVTVISKNTAFMGDRLTLIWEPPLADAVDVSKSVCTVSVQNNWNGSLEGWELWVYGKYEVCATLFHLYLRSSK